MDEHTAALDPDDDQALVDAVFGVLGERQVGFDQFFFDWYGGAASAARALASPSAAGYATPRFAALRQRLDTRQPVDTVVGMTHASSVIPVVRRKLAASAMVTRALEPLNTNPLPYLPAVVHVAFWIVPVFPLPDASFSVEPAPSSNE